MATPPTYRHYNRWVANETLEDFALRYTALRARRWSAARVANTALGIVSFLALEAIGGAITLQYGVVNAVSAMAVVMLLIFLFGLPLCYHAARSGLDIDLLTRGAGFGYLGSTLSSLIYASFTFIFFAIEASIMAMALQLLLAIPLAWGYLLSALLVIPLVTHGIRRISRFQLWTQPLWLILQIAPFAYLLLWQPQALSGWLDFTGSATAEQFDLALFGAAAALILPLMAQNGEQADFLRFLPPATQIGRRRWWLALLLSGPGWSLIGMLKLLAGSLLAWLALQHGVAPMLADDPAHMYQLAFHFLTGSEGMALLLTTLFVVVSQLKINVTNAYAGSLAWSNFFSRLTHSHPGRIVWLIFNVAIALLLMELGLYHTFESILIGYAVLVLAWIGSVVADLTINRWLHLRPDELEFRRGYLYDINPVGSGSMLLASLAGGVAMLGWGGATLAALAPFIALLLPFVSAPLIAYAGGRRYYRVAAAEATDSQGVSAVGDHTCQLCEHHFEAADTLSCPHYHGTLCSLCCALDAGCGDRCRPTAHIGAQLQQLQQRLPQPLRQIPATTAQFLLLLLPLSLLIAALFALVHAATPAAAAAAVATALWHSWLLLLIVTGVLLWLHLLARQSRQQALREAQQQSERLRREMVAHRRTHQQLQQAKEAAVAANQAKSRYLSGVSHELRTPLNTLLGYAQLLDQVPRLPATAEQAARAIRRSGEHLAEVIEGLEQFALNLRESMLASPKWRD